MTSIFQERKAVATNPVVIAEELLSLPIIEICKIQIASKIDGFKRTLALRPLVLE